MNLGKMLTQFRFQKLFITLFIISSFAACKRGESLETSSKFKVGLVLDKGGIDDKSFNASAYQGALRAKNELGILLREVEVNDDAQVEPFLKQFAQKKFDIILAIGFAQQEALSRAAEAYPETHFAIVDAVVDLPNVASLMFKEHEGSYLAGALAALTSKTKTIGFIGGMDIPLIRRFELGFKEGALKVDPQIKVISNFVGSTTDSWNNPTKAKELALSQIQQKADIIYHAAGASGLGVFDAVEEQSRSKNRIIYAIGVDSNQNGVKPGFILTSMLKRVDNAIFEIIRRSQMGEFKSGRSDFGLTDLGIDLAMDENNKPLISADVLSQVNSLRSLIIARKISVSDLYKVKGLE